MQLVHLALAETGLVIAHFMGATDAAKFCRENNLCHMPYNLDNRDGDPAPLVGSVYRP